jgi:hypothetical protein
MSLSKTLNPFFAMRYSVKPAESKSLDHSPMVEPNAANGYLSSRGITLGSVINSSGKDGAGEAAPHVEKTHHAANRREVTPGVKEFRSIGQTFAQP